MSELKLGRVRKMHSYDRDLAVVDNEPEFAVIFWDARAESLLYQKTRCRKPRVPQAKCSYKSTRIATMELIIILLVFLFQHQETKATKVKLEHRNVAKSALRFERHAAKLVQDSSSAATAIRKQSRDIRCSGPGDDLSWSTQQQQQQYGSGPASKEQERLLAELGNYFDLNATTASDKNGQLLPHLPRPSNLTVLILSWYPPILKLSWNLNELDQIVELSKYDFYKTAGLGGPALVGSSALNKTAIKMGIGGGGGGGGDSNTYDNQQLQEDKFDLELAMVAMASETGDSGSEIADNTDQQQTEFMRHLRALRKRRELVNKSLTCFQVTYNIVNSRFRVIEEYPAHLRSIHLERVQPATEYNLRVSAVYLNGRFRRTSERVQFITPTDNESRRFKENTYRPIHSYPDELREPPIGLAQVRCEELTLVGIALFFWLATICLFFNKWGKIRMLEPYQPAYREQLDVGVPPAPGGVQTLGSSPPLAGNITPSGPSTAPGGPPHLNLSSSTYNLAHHHRQLVAQTSNATTTPGGGGRHTPSLTSELGGRPAGPLCHVIDSLCMTVAPPTASQPSTINVTYPTATVDGETDEMRARAGLLAAKRESLVAGAGPVGPMSSVAAAARKSSMMILSNRRFGGAPGTAAAAASGSGLVDPGVLLPKRDRRTQPVAGPRPDLNFLFQSKAQALAKASLWWPEAAAAVAGPVSVASGGPSKTGEVATLTGQKLKQGLYRSKFGSASSAAATTDFETLRRLGKCLAARRRLTRPGAPAGSSRLMGPLERLAAQSCDVADQKQQPATSVVSDPQLRLLAQMRNSRKRAQQRLQQHQEQHQPEQQPQPQESLVNELSSYENNNNNKSAGVSFESSVNQADDLERDAKESGQDYETLVRHGRVPGTPCERSVSSGGGHLVTRFIRRNHAVDLTSPRDSPRESFRATGTQSLDQSTSDSLVLLHAAERKLATCSANSYTVEEDEEEEEEEEEVKEVEVDVQDAEVEQGDQREVDPILDCRSNSQVQIGMTNNRLKRLQFLNKLHLRHQQIAQSVSSTTLSNPRQHGQHHAYAAKSNANSLSVDGRELIGYNHQYDQQTTGVQTPEAAPEARPKTRKLTCLEITPPAEHHILIEPPSPPNNKFASCSSESPASASPLAPPAEFCTSPGSLETLKQQVRINRRSPGCGGAAAAEGSKLTHEPSNMRTSTSAFAVISASDQADRHRRRQSSGERTSDLSREQHMRNSMSETGIGPTDQITGPQHQHQQQQQQHQQAAVRLEICFDDEPATAASGEQRRHLLQLASSTSDDDDESLPLARPPAVHMRQREEAFAKLADSYRASTERRLACARSLAHLSSVATPPGSTNYCPYGQAYCATGACCHLCANDPLPAGGGAGGHPSLVGPADTDQVAVCGCHYASPTGSRLFSIGQYQQRAAAKRARRQCSHCGSIECATEQAAMALNQMCALRHNRQHQQQRHSKRQLSRAFVPGGGGGGGETSPELTSPGVVGCEMRPRMSSVFAACPTYARSHRDSFAVLRALSQRRSKSAEDIAYLSSLVLQIWAREPNPLLQSASQLQLNADQQQQQQQQRQAGADRQRKSSSSAMNLNASLCAAATLATTSGEQRNRRQSAGHHGRTLDCGPERRHRKRPRSSLTVVNL